MYAHQVVEDLKNGPQMITKDAIFFLVEKIKQAQKFNLGDWQGFVDFLPERSFDEMVRTEPDTIRMPYVPTYVDGDMTIPYTKKDNANGRFAFLFDHVNKSLIVAYSLYYKKAWSGSPVYHWSVWPTAYIYSIGKPFYEQSFESLSAVNMQDKTKDFLTGDCVERSLPIDISGYPGMTREYFYNTLVPGINETSEQTLRDVAKTMCAFCSFLSCKNITTIDNPPPEKLNKKRAKKGKCPLFTYKTLVIKPTGKKQASQEAQGLWENRVHLCRGHFKTYTEENPLFGKLTGRYWWQPSVRGNKKKGVVMKVYKFQTE
jgi:hypothetical protein